MRIKNFEKKIEKDDILGRRDEKKLQEAAVTKKKYGDGKLQRNDERRERIERGLRYIVRDGITLKMHEMVRSTDFGMDTSSRASFTSGLLKNFKITTIKIF